MIYDTDTPKMYHWYWYWYCTKNVSWYLILDTFLVSRYVSWYMYHWYSPTLPTMLYRRDFIVLISAEMLKSKKSSATFGFGCDFIRKSQYTTRLVRTSRLLQQLMLCYKTHYFRPWGLNVQQCHFSFLHTIHMFAVFLLFHVMYFRSCTFIDRPAITIYQDCCSMSQQLQKAAEILSIFSALQHIAYMLSALFAIVRPSVTRVDHTETVEVRIMKLVPYRFPIPLVFCGLSFIPKF